MVKGVSVKFGNYQETIPKLLKLIGFDKEIKKHESIVLKPDLMKGIKGARTGIEFVETILKYCMENKNPGSEVFIAEGCDGHSTDDIFDEFGYRRLSEKYGVGLIDLNNTDFESVGNPEFLRFDNIYYPSVLKDAFLVSLPVLKGDDEFEMAGALSNMIGAFPARHYKGFFSTGKNKIRKWNLKYSVHDINLCKMPDFALIDASEHGYILAGQPLEMDKQGARLLGFDWKEIGYLKLLDDTLSEERDKDKSVGELIER